MMEAAAPAPSFQETPNFEYHLYTLDRPATLTDRQSKQLTLFPPTSVKADKEFTYDGSRDQEKVRVNLVLNEHQGERARQAAARWQDTRVQGGRRQHRCLCGRGPHRARGRGRRGPGQPGQRL